MRAGIVHQNLRHAFASTRSERRLGAGDVGEVAGQVSAEPPASRIAATSSFGRRDAGVRMDDHMQRRRRRGDGRSPHRAGPRRR